MSFYRNLFPPILPAKLGAYDGAATVRVYFELSLATSRDQFKHAQVTLYQLDTNANGLSTIDYPLGIMFVDDAHILYDLGKKMYYFVLPANTLTKDKYYKLQIRLGTQDIAGLTITYQWLNDSANIQGFSEWSNVCIVKPITVPEYGVVGFIDGAEPVYNESTSTYINVANSPGFLFVGNYTLEYANADEKLSSYRFILYGMDGVTVVSDSGEKVIGAYEQPNIQHSFDILLSQGITYYVRFIVTSKNGFIGEKVYHILPQYPQSTLPLALTVTTDRDKARIELKLSGNLTGSDPNVKGYVIKRTSNRTNFKRWEDIANVSLANVVRAAYTTTLYDVFVESGIVYKYAIQPYSDTGRGGLVVGGTAIVDYQYAWMIGADEVQLKFAYNSSVSGFTRMVKDSIVETIGSKYPFVVRNANVDYVQMQFSALATHFMDVDNALMSKDNMFLAPGESIDIEVSNTEDYENYFSGRGYDPNNTYVAEREFRTKLMDFLYDGKPKVFKSDTEGVMLVKLSSVSCTPKQETGRVLYDVSCTITEIGPVNLETLIQYGIKKE